MSESGSWNFSHGKNQQRERASDSHTVPLIFVRLVERREKWKFWEKGNFEHDSHLSLAIYKDIQYNQPIPNPYHTNSEISSIPGILCYGYGLSMQSNTVGLFIILLLYT